MIAIYKTTSETNSELITTNTIEDGCWINLIAPSEEEVLLISKKTSTPLDMLKSALDDEETSRLEIDDENNLLIILDIPFTEMEDNSLIYDTYPLSIIHSENYIITVCLKKNKIINDFIEGKVRSFYTFKRSRFILQILLKISLYYLTYLRQIDKKSLMIEKKLHKSLKNKELIQLLTLEKSLVYFSTSLKSNELTIDKLRKLPLMQKYEDDDEILEDVIIETRQAIEMANIYSNILTGTMDAFASVISNNLNIVMKWLAGVTIVLTIPNIISGVFGMNLSNPFEPSGPVFGFWIVVGTIVALCSLVLILLYKKDMI